MVLIVCITIAWLLGAIVVLSRLFSTSLKIEEMLKYGQNDAGKFRIPNYLMDNLML